LSPLDEVEKRREGGKCGERGANSQEGGRLRSHRIEKIEEEGPRQRGSLRQKDMQKGPAKKNQKSCDFRAGTGAWPRKRAQERAGETKARTTGKKVGGGDEKCHAGGLRRVGGGRLVRGVLRHAYRKAPARIDHWKEGEKAWVFGKMT